MTTRAFVLAVIRHNVEYCKISPFNAGQRSALNNDVWNVKQTSESRRHIVQMCGRNALHCKLKLF